MLLLHGFPGLAFSWRHQVEPLVAAGFRVIAPDMPGYGATDSPGGVAEYTFAAVADRVVALLDSLEVQQAIVVGHDFGAPTAWTVALEHRERVAGLVLLAMPYAPDRLPIRPSDAYSALAQQHFFPFRVLHAARSRRGRTERGTAEVPHAALPRLVGELSLPRHLAASEPPRRPPTGVPRRTARSTATAVVVAVGRGPRRIRDRFPQNRIHRWSELVPRRGPQLGERRRRSCH
ncbi:alpha/beta fold hydrolase [Williamsia sp. D3]|uniref:alpha/beta fold hydrolase n=1 Tax=Williamsia sp. D3 TaxID=1313067 RepID=UPI00350F2C92